MLDDDNSEGGFEHEYEYRYAEYEYACWDGRRAADLSLRCHAKGGRAESL